MASVKEAEISDYGVIGNCRTAALVSNRGSIDWCCFPKFDSPSYFARILDPQGGHFSVMPARLIRSEQVYIDESNVLQTRFETQEGSAVLTDFFSVRSKGSRPNELWPDEEILRIVEGREGETDFTLELFPRADYGQRGIQFRRIGDWGIKGSDGRKHFLLQTSALACEIHETSLGASVHARFKVKAGDKVTISLSYSDEAPAVMPPLSKADERLEQTHRYWREWVSKCEASGEYRKVILRSALALKLLNYAPSGAFVAAPTTSLPEWIGGSRNWDYRFCWLRDSAFTTRALVRLGRLDEAKSFLNWLLHSTRLTWPRLRVLYTLYGESQISECQADWLQGFQGSKPVRLGNEASSQLQLDVYGEVIDSFYSLSEFLHPIDRETRKMVVSFGESVAQLWNQPDQGIWEFRTVPKHYTHSKVMCWVAMDRMKKLSERFKWKLSFDPDRIAEEIRLEVESLAFDSKLGVYTQAFHDPALDANILVMPLVGYCRADSPRYLATRDAIIRKLSRNDLIYRYPPELNQIPEPEGAFTLCNFWLAEVYARSGNLKEAERWLNAVMRVLPPTGLASEQINPENRKFLGNHHQGFSHIGLINATLAIEEMKTKLKEGKQSA